MTSQLFFFHVEIRLGKPVEYQKVADEYEIGSVAEGVGSFSFKKASSKQAGRRVKPEDEAVN